MIPRKALAPNNRKSVSLVSEFYTKQYYKSPTNNQTAFSYARAGRQNSEGFGGGRIIEKR